MKTSLVQFTSDAFTHVLKEAGARISMDGKGRWTDNVMIERLWRSLKYECIYLHAFETGSEVRQGSQHTTYTMTTFLKIPPDAFAHNSKHNPYPWFSTAVDPINAYEMACPSPCPYRRPAAREFAVRKIDTRRANSHAMAPALCCQLLPPRSFAH